MKLRGYVFCAACLAFGIYSVHWDDVHAEELEAQLRPVTITGYCVDGITKSGQHTRPGICAYKPQDIGKTAIVYADTPGRELIGIYEIADTGKKSIRDGYVLDIWFETKEECYAITQKALVQVIDADG